MRHGGQTIVPFAEVYWLARDHDPDGLIRKDHNTFLSAATKAAARSGLQSGATCKTAPQISTRTTPLSADPAALAKGSITSGTNAGVPSIGTTSSPLRARPRHSER